MKCGYSSLLIGQVVLIFQFMIVRARHTNHHRKELDLCFRCPVGFGVTNRCTSKQDTECAPCQQDYYSSHKSSHRPCYPCSRCGVGLYVAHECTPMKDTVCDSCHTYQGPHNEDFYDKCILPLFTETTTSNSQNKGDITSVALTNQQWSAAYEALMITALIAAPIACIVFVYFVVRSVKKLNKQANSNYPYQAVATQEAVML